MRRLLQTVAVGAVVSTVPVWAALLCLMRRWADAMPRAAEGIYVHYVKTPWAAVYLDGASFSLSQALQMTVAVLTVTGIACGLVIKLFDGQFKA